jgi:hypothetical protein
MFQLYFVNISKQIYHLKYFVFILATRLQEINAGLILCIKPACKHLIQSHITIMNFAKYILIASVYAVMFQVKPFLRVLAQNFTHGPNFYQVPQAQRISVSI